MTIKRRYVLGSLISSLAIGGALALDQLGPVARPDPLTVQFSRGTTLAQGEDARLAAYIGAHIAEPQLMFHVLGHTGDRGDDAANLELSRKRAEVISKALENAGVPSERILSVEGAGSAAPLPAEDGESDAVRQRRMARTVVTALVQK